MVRRFSRRAFLKGGSLAAGSTLCGGFSILPGGEPPSEKLNIGIIGAGGKGGADLAGVSSENIAALCDVDSRRAAPALKRYPKAARYTDYRKMLEKEKGLDAVTVSTPDHHHAPAALMAMALGRHVYCQKPLTHSVSEARLMRAAAKKYKVATQMGNQGHSEHGSRRMVELIRAGTLGTVSEVHVWSNRPIWPQGINRPAGTQPVPTGLDWGLWIGPAPQRPYHEAYVPFKWRGWWDFGTGALGDMACHNWDIAYWALELGLPESLEAESSPLFKETAPQWSVIRYRFPAIPGRPAVKLTWYDGPKRPPAELFEGEAVTTNGSIIIGDKGKLYIPHYWGDGKLLPKKDFVGFKAPGASLPRSPGHYREWITACKGGPAALSNFDYSAQLTEAVLLGNLAVRLGGRIDWDAKNMKATGRPEADVFVKRAYRPGYMS